MPPNTLDTLVSVLAAASGLAARLLEPEEREAAVAAVRRKVVKVGAGWRKAVAERTGLPQDVVDHAFAELGEHLALAWRERRPGTHPGAGEAKP